LGYEGCHADSAQGLTAAVVDGKIYAIGGANDTVTGNLAFGTVEVFDLNANSWSTGMSLPTPRFHSAAAVVDGVIYVIGGRSGDAELSTVEAFTP
jgi:N-acetylneuraminic acid mutarotase